MTEDAETENQDENMGQSEYLLNRLKQIEEQYSRLKEDYEKVQDEKKSIESERVRYEREVRRLRSEIERLRSPPLLVGHISDILDDGRIIIKSSAGPKFVAHSSQYLDKEELEPGTRIAMNQQTLAVVGVLPSPKDPTVYGFEVDERPDVGYADVGGLENQTNELREIVELPITKPHLFEDVGIQPPNGVLLNGSPGTGKTLLAKAVANYTNATFIRVVGSELVRKFIGEGARLVREVFEYAKEKAPSIIFIDELDAIAARRTGSDMNGDREVQRTLMQLLAEMDGFDPRGEVKLIGATNRIDILDPAILRPGRFDRIIEIPIPDFDERQEIFKVHTRGMNINDEVNFNRLAEITDSCSGADIRAIVTEAGMLAIRDERIEVQMEDFANAIDKVTKKGVDQSEMKGVMFG